jgi:hypothetical protein
MAVERFVKQSVWASSLTSLAIGLCGSQALAQQEQSQQQDVEVAVAPGEAQQAQPLWNGVRVVQVKHDRTGDFEALIKELGTALSAAGLPPISVWQVEIGDVNTYHIVSQFESFADVANEEAMPMEPMEWATWMNRIGATIDSHQAMIARVRLDMSVMPEAQGQQGSQGAQDGQTPEEPELLMLMATTVLPGRAQDYENWIRDEVLPVMRESDGLGVVTNQMAFGADDRMWVFAIPLSGWSELDMPSPLHRSLGEAAAEELLSRGDAMIERREATILRSRPDLSTSDDGA